MTNNLIEGKSTIKSRAVYSKDKKSRYLLEFEWDKDKPSCAIIMKCPGTADSLIMDRTTMLVRNNAADCGFGSVKILNLFPQLTGNAMVTDKVNASIILDVCKSVDKIIVAYGRSDTYAEEKDKMLEMLQEFKGKLLTIEDSNGNTFTHPLSPKALVWKLVEL